MQLNEIPGFPTLVVKNNERIRRYDASRTKNQRIQTIDPKGAVTALTEFEFIDPAFNGTTSHKPNSSKQIQVASINPLFDNILTDAYNIMGTGDVNWQRDNIYYGLTPTATKGPLKSSITESIYRIKFAVDALPKLTEHPSRPKLKWEISIFDYIRNGPAWTDGRFEIKIEILINDKSGAGSTITKYINVSPNDLFAVTYKKLSFLKYQVERIDPKYYHPTNLDIMTWDLESRSFTWKLSFTEENETVVTTRSETYSSEFATNFGFDAGWGDKVKIGLKFGASSRETQSQTYSVAVTSGSKDLGSVEVSFSDPVLVPGSDPENSGSAVKLYEKSNPYITLATVPRKTY
nr:hypothetical protein [uncultured Chitinophaga sp.]